MAWVGEIVQPQVVLVWVVPRHVWPCSGVVQIVLEFAVSAAAMVVVVVVVQVVI